MGDRRQLLVDIGLIDHQRLAAAVLRLEAHILQQLFHNEWVNLVALDPGDVSFHRYRPDASWERLELDANGAALTSEGAS